MNARSVPEAALRVSVCVCTRHRPDELRRCLHSLRRSTLPVEHVVVSDDSEPADVRTRALMVEEFPGILYVEGPRRGLGANRNYALAQAHGSHILFLDDDAELAPNFIASMDQFVRENRLSPCDIITGLELKAGVLVEPRDQVFWGHQKRVYAAGMPFNTVVINATLFPVGLFEDVAFDPQLIYGLDEVDITTRARRAGYRISLNAEAVNPHHETLIGRDYYEPYREASRLYATWKRYALTEQVWTKAAVYAVAAPLHLLAYNVRRRGVSGFMPWVRSVRTAAGYAHRHVRGRSARS